MKLMKLFKRKSYSKHWHNLIKDPNDLPLHSNQVIVQCGDSNESEISSYYKGQWILNRDTEVIAWIEKPRFWKN